MTARGLPACAAACHVPISFCLHQRGLIPSARWNVTTEHPKYHLSPPALKNTDIFQQCITPLLPQQQTSGFLEEPHVPTHTLVSHHLTTLCFLLLATTISLRLFAKGLLLLLIVPWESEAKCVNGKGGGRRLKWSLVLHNSPLSLAVLGSLLSSFHLQKPGCWPQHNIATGEREEEGLTFIYFSAIIRIMSGGKSINT